MRTPVTIEMFLDVSCPWCHGGLERNRRLLDELAGDPEVPPLVLVWRFMRLHELPRPGGVPVDEYFAVQAGDHPGAVEDAHRGIQAFAASAGVVVDRSRYTFLHDPTTAHRLLCAARDDAGDDLPSLWSVARAVFSANFGAGIDITSVPALRRAVESAGLAVPERIWRRIGDGGGADGPMADRARAKQVGLDGVPRMYVHGQIVPTWVAPEAVRQQLRGAIGVLTSSG